VQKIQIKTDAAKQKMSKIKSIEELLNIPENRKKWVEQIKINDLQKLSHNQRAEIMAKLFKSFKHAENQKT